MSMDVEAMMKAALDGRFYAINMETHKVNMRQVPKNYIPSHASRMGTSSGEDSPVYNPWTDDEDRRLMSCRAKYMDWASIAKVLRRNNGKCRERYLELCRVQGIEPIIRIANPPSLRPVGMKRLAGEVPRRMTAAGTEPKLEEIMQAVSYVVQIAPYHIKSHRRNIEFIKARRVFCWIALQYTGKSSVEVGRHCGGRDHSTVLHAVSKVEYDFSSHAEVINRVLGVLEIEQAKSTA